MYSHLMVISLASSVTGCTVFRMMAAMALLSLQPAGAVTICTYGTPGSVKGTTGHPHGVNSRGSSGKFTSATFMLGKPPNRACRKNENLEF
jgi:hypothetical protein